MQAINHALTGAVIGLVVTEPAIAIPAALLSHFVVDAVPHYGSKAVPMYSLQFRRLLLADAVLCIALVVVLVMIRPRHWLVAAICAFAAASPDFMWVVANSCTLAVHIR